jgi:hypothetical protein
MTRTIWWSVPVALLHAGCGGTNGDGNGAGAASGAGGNAAVGGFTSGGTSAGTGAAGAGTGGSSGGAMGGSSGSAGSSAGKGGSSGSAGSSAGKGGSAGSAGSLVPTGSIGPGPVTCSSVTGDCTNAACCRAITGYSCVASFAECPCSAQGACTAVGCEVNADCGAEKCCALRNTRASPGYVATSCKSACDEATEVAVCATVTDCADGEECLPGSAGFSFCF